MGIFINYGEIAEEIFNAEERNVILVIRRYSKITIDPQIDFFNSTIDALVKNNQYNDELKKRSPNVKITSPIDGELLYLNKSAKPWEPYFIIGENDYDINVLVSLTEEYIKTPKQDNDGFFERMITSFIVEGKNPKPSIRDVVEKSTNLKGQKLPADFKNSNSFLKLMESKKVKIIMGRKYVFMSNRYVKGVEEKSFVFHKELNHRVIEGDLIVSYEDFNLTERALILQSNFKVAYDYCKSKINELNGNVIDSNNVKETSKAELDNKKKSKNPSKNEEPIVITPNSLFRKIQLDKYDRIVEVLSKDLPPNLQKKYSEIKKPFVEVLTDKLIWHGSINHLAGMISICQEKKWIQPNLKPIQYVRIVNELFTLNIKSRTAFVLMGDNVLKPKYVEVFTELFKDIK